MINWIKKIFNKDYRTFGVVRSPRWSFVRKTFIKLHPNCAVCDTTKKLEVHHLIPVHIDKTKELQNDNLITLCREHHLLFGHLLNWTSYNKEVLNDTIIWNNKIKNRT